VISITSTITPNKPAQEWPIKSGRGSGNADPKSSRVKLVLAVTIPLTLELFYRGQIKYLQSRGFEITAISAPGDALDRVAARDGIKVFPVKMYRRISPLADLIACYRMFRLFRRLRPDIVHSSTGKAGPLAMIAAFLAGTPVRIYSLRGIMMDRGSRWTRKLFAVMEWVTGRLADRVFAVSASVASIMTNAKLCPERKIVVPGFGSSNGVDATDLFNPEKIDKHEVKALRRRLGIPEDASVIGFVGRLVSQKGINELIKAWKSVNAEIPDYYLLLIGPEEEQDPISSEALDVIRSDPRIRLLDLVPNEEMPTHYALMNFLVLPTYSEGFPNVILEAAAMGLPSIASNVSGCVDAVVDGQTGVLVPAKNAEALGQAILAYAKNQGVAQAHGKAARERVLRDYRPELVWEAVADEYERLATGRKC
jgi:glycosyltransferase involved in cell wall biosynthesis